MRYGPGMELKKSAVLIHQNMCWTHIYIYGILPKGPYPPCLRMADRALLARYPRIEITILFACEMGWWEALWLSFKFKTTLISLQNNVILHTKQMPQKLFANISSNRYFSQCSLLGKIPKPLGHRVFLLPLPVIPCAVHGGHTGWPIYLPRVWVTHGHAWSHWRKTVLGMIFILIIIQIL